MNTIGLNRSFVILDEVGEPVSSQVLRAIHWTPDFVEDDNVLVLFTRQVSFAHLEV